ncbi:MAG: HEPN domain-containing protein [Nitrospirota bacterium]
MVNIEIVREWIAKADDDFGFALANHEEGKPFLALICFHFQQSAEKYLKAYIVAHGLEFKKTHDLHALLKTCTQKDTSLEQINADCEYLNTFYIETRYPVHWPTHFTEKEAVKAKSAAHRIRQWITSALDSLLTDTDFRR